MKVILFGASGMVGKGVLMECLKDPGITAVLSVGRGPCGVKNPKLREIVQKDFTDFSNLKSQWKGSDACFFCLGVSSAGMSEKDYRHITYDFTLAAATVLARLNPKMTFTYVTGAGTDSTGKGGLMWARVKGQTENALLKLFKSAYMFRPGLIVPREGVVPKNKWLDLLLAFLAPLVSFFRWLLPRYVTTTRIIGRAMIRAAREGAPQRRLESWDINELGGPDEPDSTYFPPRNGDDLSSHAQRQLIGCLGFILPFLVWIMANLRPTPNLLQTNPLDSISASYYTPAVVAFAGVLAALATFLFTYQGYGNDYKGWDQLAGKVACFAALGVAFFPTAAPENLFPPGWWSPWMMVIHYGSATLLFSAFAFYSLVLFPKSNLPKEKLPRDKKERNIAYVLCGWGILACMAWTAYAGLALKTSIFIPETGVLWIFSFSWLVKGQADWTALEMGKALKNYVKGTAGSLSRFFRSNRK